MFTAAAALVMITWLVLAFQTTVSGTVTLIFGLVAVVLILVDVVVLYIRSA